MWYLENVALKIVLIIEASLVKLFLHRDKSNENDMLSHENQTKKPRAEHDHSPIVTAKTFSVCNLPTSSA